MHEAMTAPFSRGMPRGVLGHPVWGGAGAWSPLMLPGVEHFCDFSTLGLADNTPLDTAGQVRPWVQGTTAARPTIRTGSGGINGQPAAVFDGDDWMTLNTYTIGNGVTLYPYPGQPYSLAVVVSIGNTAISQAVIGRLSTAPPSTVFSYLHTNTNILRLTNRSPGTTDIATGYATAGVPVLVQVDWNGTSMSGRLNGRPWVPMIIGTGVDNTTEHILLGKRTNQDLQWLSAGSKVGFTMITEGSIGAQGFDQLLGWARDKWGVA
jgi:hypothetical protein